MDAGDQSLVGDEQQGQARCFIDAAALCFDDAVLDLVAHAQAVAPADAVGFQNELGQAFKGLAVERNGLAFFKAHRDFFALDFNVVFPERHAHDGVDDLHAAGQVLQVFGLVCGAQHVGVGRVGFFGGHLVAKAGFCHEGRHFGAPAQLVNEQLVQPGFVNFQIGVGQQAVAVKTLDVIALVGAAVAPDIDLVLFHGGHQHGAGDSAAQRRGVEVSHAGGRDVEGAALQCGNAFGGQLAAAVDQAGFFCAVLHGLARNVFVIGLVGLAQVGGVGVGNRAFEFHPVQRGAGVQTARKSDADFLPEGKVLKNGAHDSARFACAKGINRSGRCSGRARSRGCRRTSCPAR